jgi:hypothetical protein
MGRSRAFLSAVALAAAAAAVPGAQALEIDPSPQALAAVEAVTPLLEIAVVDLGDLAPDVLRAAWSQTAAVLERLGSGARIRSAAPDDVQAPGAITVVLMPGRPGPQLRPTVLGVVRRAAAPRVLWLFPEAVAAALGLPAPAGVASSPKEQAIFATALGRVAAHELVHLLCPSRPHDRAGLMAERMSQAVLRGGPLTFDDALRRDFERGAVHAAGAVADARSSPNL